MFEPCEGSSCLPYLPLCWGGKRSACLTSSLAQLPEGTFELGDLRFSFGASVVCAGSVWVSYCCMSERYASECAVDVFDSGGRLEARPAFLGESPWVRACPASWLESGSAMSRASSAYR